MSAPSALPAVVEHGVGLVVMLDAAGRTIAQLEEQVDRLARAVAEERQLRLELTELLRAAREGAATADVPQPFTQGGEDCAHDHPTDPATVAPPA